MYLKSVHSLVSLKKGEVKDKSNDNNKIGMFRLSYDNHNTEIEIKAKIVLTFNFLGLRKCPGVFVCF